MKKRNSNFLSLAAFYFIIGVVSLAALLAGARIIELTTDSGLQPTQTAMAPAGDDWQCKQISQYTWLEPLGWERRVYTMECIRYIGKP